MTRSERFDKTGLFYRVADPADERLDDFEPGPTECAKEEAQYFQSRGWTGALDGRECSCIQLVTEADDVVGYIAFQAVPKPHPTTKSKTTSDYLFLYHLWIGPNYHGQDDQGSEDPARWSVETMRLIEHVAALISCVGVYLNVRVDNEPALKLYARLGYADDGGYTSKVTGHQMRRMRKSLT